MPSCLRFGPREELTSPARQNVTTNRPRRRYLADEHGLVALGLAARAKRRCLNLFNNIRARGTDEEGPPAGMPRGMIGLCILMLGLWCNTSEG